MVGSRARSAAKLFLVVILGVAFMGVGVVTGVVIGRVPAPVHIESTCHEPTPEGVDKFLESEGSMEHVFECRAAHADVHVMAACVQRAHRCVRRWIRWAVRHDRELEGREQAL